MSIHRSTDISICGVKVYLLPISTRVPLKFGAETLTEVTCLRVAVEVEDQRGHRAVGWGETPLNVQWVWPSSLGYQARLAALQELVIALAQALEDLPEIGHAFELGVEWIEHLLPSVLEGVNKSRPHAPIPYLASLLVASAFDIAIHDAHGMVANCDTYQLYGQNFLDRPVADFLELDVSAAEELGGRYLDEFLVRSVQPSIPVWHLVGAADLLEEGKAVDRGPDSTVSTDGYPVYLSDWIRADGLTRLKIKLTGQDLEWDYERIRSVGRIGLSMGVTHLSADFNCTVQEPAYVCEVLDRLQREAPSIWQALVYVEQPFPYDLERWGQGVQVVSQRKPLFMDESAHDWRCVRYGFETGWTGVALKTCKTQTGALLSLCWARTHGMGIMVQDLTNPMLAQIPHVRLAAHAGTLWGVESNAMQYYPEASGFEATVHPGLYKRRNGRLDLSSLYPPQQATVGFGYRVDRVARPLPDPLYSS